MKRLIYRIEDDKEQGFFRTGIIQYRKLKGLHVPPSPIEDEGIKRSSIDNERCGFLNDKQLHTWVRSNELKMIRRHGFKLKRIYREVTAIGEYQVLYKDV